MAKVRANFFEGTLASQLSSGATSMSCPALADFPVVSSPDVAYLVVGDSEIVKVTTHTAASTSATIVRAQIGTSAATWPAGTGVVQAPLANDAPTVLTDAEYDALSEVDPDTIYITTG